MTAAANAIYENGLLRLMTPLPLPEHTAVRVLVETLPVDAERAEWLAQGERKLVAVWNNDQDDVYNALLAE